MKESFENFTFKAAIVAAATAACVACSEPSPCVYGPPPEAGTPPLQISTEAPSYLEETPDSPALKEDEEVQKDSSRLIEKGTAAAVTEPAPSKKTTKQPEEQVREAESSTSLPVYRFYDNERVQCGLYGPPTEK